MKRKILPGLPSYESININAETFNDKKSIISHNSYRSQTTRRSRKSHKNNRKEKHKKALNSIYNYSFINKSKNKISLTSFFNGICSNYELGKDFLKEMNMPICTSHTINVPITINTIFPGRCLNLSPFGHSLILGSHCEKCTLYELNSIPTEFNSLELLFFNNVGKYIENKAFYLSLLSLSIDAILISFRQPCLIYSYILFNHFIQGSCPIFTSTENGKIRMFLFFKTLSIHVCETCLKLLCEHVGNNYDITVDITNECIFFSFYPNALEEKPLAADKETILENIKTLECSDELRHNISTFTYLCDSICKSESKVKHSKCN